MIQISSLSKAFGDRILFENVDWQISKNDRIGLCGANGSGKTTLLKMLCDMEPPDTGYIQKPSALTIGFLPQDGILHVGRSVFEEACLAFQDLLDLKAQMHSLEDQLGDASLPQEEHEAVLARYSHLQERFRQEEGYAIDLKVATVLSGLGFRKAGFQQETSTLSGGWQMRLALAKLLLLKPKLLLLDEPTNHLDIDARNWLESYLSGYPHAVVLISHDRYFLDAVVTRISEVGLKTLTDYPGTYSRFLVERDARIERLREAKERQDEEIARIKVFIDRFRYQATRASQVQSRIKMLEKIKPIDVPPQRKRVHFNFPACAKGGRIAFELRRVHKAYGDNEVFRSVDLHIERGERIAIVGLNGAGKSTLMRLLTGVEPSDDGERIEGHQVVMQYFAQDEAARLDITLTVHETLAVGSPTDMVPMIRNILGGFLFSGDDVYKSVGVLSGGERTRLAVARMLLRPSNTLLLDEPTNHLDIDSKDVLLNALIDYGGTLIFVSHDRYFLDRLATKIIEVGDGKATLYPGTYEEFLEQKRRQEMAAQEENGPGGKSAASSDSSDNEARASKSAWGERKRAVAEGRKRERVIKSLQSQIFDLESQIAKHEQMIRDLEVAMAEPHFYDDHASAREHIDRHQSLVKEVEQRMQQWEEVNRAFAEMTTMEASAKTADTP